MFDCKKEASKEFWAKVVYTTLYLLNRLPISVAQEKTPIEAWTRVKPYAKHMEIFGSNYYVHVAAVKRSKLDDRAEMRTFLRYATHSKGYKVYNLKSKQIIISWDIQRSMKFEQQQDTNDDEIQIAKSSSLVLKKSLWLKFMKNEIFLVHKPSCFGEASMKNDRKMK